jgi:thioredoxin-related protein
MLIRLLIIAVVLISCSSSEVQTKSTTYDEPSLKTFVLNTPVSNQATASKQLDSILINASSDSAVFRQTISYLESPFCNPNSSYRNQNLYAKLLQAEMNSKWHGAYEKEVAAGKLKLLQQNNVGDTANDFIYLTAAGYKKKMYDIKSDFVLLYFNNPECPACKEMKEALMKSGSIGLMVKSSKLKVLSIYTDKDEKLWLDHLSEYPETWLQGRDEDEYLYKNKIYDLRAIPTIYLLDKDKKVLLKDCTNVREIERALGTK